MPCCVIGRSVTCGTNKLALLKVWLPVPGLALRMAVPGARIDAVLVRAALVGRAKLPRCDPVFSILLSVALDGGLCIVVGRLAT